jgi:hypothetical protein
MAELLGAFLEAIGMVLEAIGMSAPEKMKPQPARKPAPKAESGK